MGLNAVHCTQDVVFTPAMMSVRAPNRCGAQSQIGLIEAVVPFLPIDHHVAGISSSASPGSQDCQQVYAADCCRFNCRSSAMAFQKGFDAASPESRYSVTMCTMEFKGASDVNSSRAASITRRHCSGERHCRHRRVEMSRCMSWTRQPSSWDRYESPSSPPTIENAASDPSANR